MYGNVFTEKPLLKTYFLNYYHFLQENSVRKLCMVIFLLSFVKGSKSAEGGPNPLADMDPGGPILGGSKSARTPAFRNFSRFSTKIPFQSAYMSV